MDVILGYMHRVMWNVIVQPLSEKFEIRKSVLGIIDEDQCKHKMR